MKRAAPAALAVLLSAAVLVLQGCGGGDGLSAANLARIAQAETDAAEALTDVDALRAQVKALIAQAADAEPGAADTADIDAALAVLRASIDDLTEQVVGQRTALEILGGTKSTMGIGDRVALARRIAWQLNATYDHDKDRSLINLPDIDGSGMTSNKALTRNRSHASNPANPATEMTKINTDEGGFLTHTFEDTGTMVDLTSPGDIATLRLGNLLKVDGVDLKSFSLRETDKVKTESGEWPGGFGAGAAGSFKDNPAVADSHMLTLTLGRDGSRSVAVKDGAGDIVFSDAITYVRGYKVVEYDMARGTALDADARRTLPARNIIRDDRAAHAAGMVTQPNGNTLTILRGARADDGSFTAGAAATDTAYNYNPARPSWRSPAAADRAFPVVDRSIARAAYADAGAAFTIARHNAMGYGAWLADSFFMAYTISAEDDGIFSDPRRGGLQDRLGRPDAQRRDSVQPQRPRRVRHVEGPDGRLRPRRRRGAYVRRHAQGQRHADGAHRRGGVG